MAIENLSPAPRTPAASHPYGKANPSYGKRTVSEQRPPSAADFAPLPERERYVAGYIDRLPDGSAMDVKSLAKALPLYGQMAVGSALRALSTAGHLRRVRCQVVDAESQSRWVTRTFWSRTSRDSEWWNAFAQAGSAPLLRPAAPSDEPAAEEFRTAQAEPVRQPERPHPAPAPPTPAAPLVPRQRSVAEGNPAAPSPAYLALAQLGRREPRLTLSATDCAVLEELASAWLDRGVNTDYLTRALTAGLPAQVDSPVGFVRRRLIDKVPPGLPATASHQAPDGPVRRIMMECTECGMPGRSEALPDGLCRACRAPAQAPGDAPETLTEAPVERDINALVGNLRNLMRTP
ncbi:MarR family transcriptional regulator [Streptomyces sp. NBC_00385]|uniref:MarR family transcriptional regulator n=1 Tax=Streptomyces sp. NBC_00385 TaxID=2975733 RepID=UPI002DDAEA04|nr:MarR family transcriptional regulator [Streptomyces sp. NBC_00385]WRZ06484.1 MarR family transcriptional regulator [Streptomyces sp. NBC_00385]